MKKKAQYYIRKHYDRPVSKREFLQEREQDIKKLCISQKHLLQTKTFSLKTIRSYEKSGVLTPIRYKRQKYFKKDEIIALLEKGEKTMSRARQLGLFEK